MTQQRNAIKPGQKKRSCEHPDFTRSHPTEQLISTPQTQPILLHGCICNYAPVGIPGWHFPGSPPQHGDHKQRSAQQKEDGQEQIAVFRKIKPAPENRHNPDNRNNGGAYPFRV
ncbi:hypothetical protein D3C81_1297380 [compost metagenome]